MIAVSHTSSAELSLRHYKVFCFAFLINTHQCLGISDFKAREKQEMNGLVCNEETRLFAKACPSAISCVFECSSNAACVLFSFVEDSNLCIGCPCESYRNQSTLTRLNGAVFYAHNMPTMFEGRCGTIHDDDITVEYLVNTSYSNKVFPGVRMGSVPSWAPEEEMSYFLKIDFKQDRLVTKIKTKGRKRGKIEEFVRTYAVYTSSDCETKHFLKTIFGNTDGIALTRRLLPNNVLTRCLYIKPEKWVNYPALRIDLDGF